MLRCSISTSRRGDEDDGLQRIPRGMTGMWGTPSEADGVAAADQALSELVLGIDIGEIAQGFT